MATRDTDENPRDRLLAAEQRLLAEGIPSYLDAMMAIQELQQTIQKRCRRVLREGLEAFAQAIGMSLLDANIEDVAEPNNVRVTDDGTCLGVKIPPPQTVSRTSKTSSRSCWGNGLACGNAWAG